MCIDFIKKTVWQLVAVLFFLLIIVCSGLATTKDWHEKSCNPPCCKKQFTDAGGERIEYYCIELEVNCRATAAVACYWSGEGVGHGGDASGCVVESSGGGIACVAVEVGGDIGDCLNPMVPGDLCTDADPIVAQVIQDALSKAEDCSIKKNVQGYECNPANITSMTRIY